jgi:hypothetical protein
MVGGGQDCNCRESDLTMVQLRLIPILSVEDHPVYRQGLATIVGAEPDTEHLSQSRIHDLAFLSGAAGLRILRMLLRKLRKIWGGFSDGHGQGAACIQQHLWHRSRHTPISSIE